MFSGRYFVTSVKSCWKKSEKSRGNDEKKEKVSEHSAVGSRTGRDVSVAIFGNVLR